MDKQQLYNYMDTCRKLMNTIRFYESEIEKSTLDYYIKDKIFFHGKNSGVRDIPTKEITFSSLLNTFFSSFLSSIPLAFLISIIAFFIIGPIVTTPGINSKITFWANFSSYYLGTTYKNQFIISFLFAYIIVTPVIVKGNMSYELKQRDNLNKLKEKLKANLPTIEQYKEQLPILKNELQNERNKNIIPENYFTSSRLYIFQQYLENQRSNNLQECINLYHVELQHNQFIDSINAHEDKLNSIQRDLIDLQAYHNQY